jgi:hypothetical protein
MNKIMKTLRGVSVLSIAAVIGITAASAFGQAVVTKERAFCNNNWSNGDQFSANDLRELKVASTGSLNVDSGQNGGISVKGEDRADVLVRACVQAWGPSEEAARATIASVRINTSGEIKADGPESSKFSVSYQILVPRTTDVNLKAHNGGISLANLDGTATFETTNGGISISNLAGKVKGRTANGGVNAILSGTSWKGSGLDLQTTNGGVNLVMPKNYAATVETGTVNGGFRSDIPALTVQEDSKGDDWGRSRSKRIVSSINGGGAPIRVITTNGGVKISSLED